MFSNDNKLHDCSNMEYSWSYPTKTTFSCIVKHLYILLMYNLLIFYHHPTSTWVARAQDWICICGQNFNENGKQFDCETKRKIHNQNTEERFMEVWWFLWVIDAEPLIEWFSYQLCNAASERANTYHDILYGDNSALSIHLDRW